MRRPRGSDDGGFTLVELMLVIAILGVIMVPLSNFVISYFKTYPVTQTRLSESHDAQIAAAYLSQDVADTGLRGSASPYAPQQSVWTPTSGFPATYCGKGLGTAVLLLEWNSWTVSSGTGTPSTNSATYLVKSDSTLHRLYCAGSTTPSSDATMVHNFVYPDSGNANPVTCQATPSGSATAGACGTATPPTNVNFKLSIKGPADTSVWYVTLSGQRRQAAS
jgi:prepilin-type N-terminal cleavage/methylation domain-containing protein